jgi:hypothetical protein
MEDGGQARGAGHASSSSFPQRSASPIRSDSRGFRAAVSDVGHKLREFYTFDLMPKTFIIKFRQRVQGVQLGANFEVNCQTLSSTMFLVSVVRMFCSYDRMSFVPHRRH